MTEASGIPRRSVVSWSLSAAALATLSACGVRIDNIPAVTVTGTRPPAVDEPLLLAALHRCRALAGAARSLGNATGTELAAAHDTQVRTLRDRIARLGVPASILDGPPPQGAAAVALGPLEARARELAAATAASGADGDNRGILTALLVQQSVAAQRLGIPAALPSSPDVAAAALPGLLAARYALQVAAAQAGGPTRTRLTQTLATLGELRARLATTAGAAAPAPAPAYPLPVRPHDDPSAAELATASLRRLADDAFAQAVTAGVSGSGEVLAQWVSWCGTVGALAATWGMPGVAFPGMSEAG